MIYRNYPIDREVEYIKQHLLTTLKFLPKNEEIFREHFPEESIYPGSMILNCVFTTLERFLNKEGKQLDIANVILNKVMFKKKCNDGEILKVTVLYQGEEKDKEFYKFEVEGCFEEKTLCLGKLVVKRGE